MWLITSNKVLKLYTSLSVIIFMGLSSAYASQSVEARYLQIELPGDGRVLSLAEVEVYSGEKLISLDGRASQVSTHGDADAARAIDGNINGRYFEGSVTHTKNGSYVWWELDLGAEQGVTGITLYNRTDCCGERNNPARVLLLSKAREIVWEDAVLTNAPRYDFLIKETVKSQPKVSPNLLRNATFRQRTNPSIPDYWDLHHAAALAFKDLHEQYYVDENIEPPVEGAHVLVVRNSEEHFRFLAIIPRTLYSILPRGVYTYSVYIKADRPGSEFNVTPGWGKGETIVKNISTKWKRYSFKYTLTDSGLDTLQPIMRFPMKGTYYISAPQLEKGIYPTVFQAAYEDSVPQKSRVDKSFASRISRITKPEKKKAKEILSANFEYDYYTDDDVARIRLSSAYHSDLIANIECTVSSGNALSFSFPENIKLLPYASESIDIPISNLPIGEYICNTRVSGDGIKRADVKIKLKKISPHPVEVRFNKNRRIFTINNQPFFIIGIGALGATPPDWYLSELKDHGINTIFFQCRAIGSGGLCAKKVKNLLVSAKKFDLKVIVGLAIGGAKPADWRERISAFSKLIGRVKDHPSIIGWYPVDEPAAYSWQDKELMEIYAAIKELDPYRFVFVNWAHDGVPGKVGQQPRGTLSATDIYSIDYYPFAGLGRTLNGFTETTIRALETARMNNKAAHSWLQIYGGIDAWREPTGGELRYMAYLNYLYGGMISYWDTKSNSPLTWESLSIINHQGRELADKLFLNMDAYEILRPVSSGNFIYSAWKVDKSIIMLVVHMGGLEENFVYAVSNLRQDTPFTSVQQMFEKRDIQLINGHITENFQPFEARAYELMSE